MNRHILPYILKSSAQKHPRHSAIIFGQKRINYSQLDELTDNISSGLVSLGLNKSDKVAIFLDNCPEFVISYFAILKAGCVAVPLNYMLKIEEAKFILEDSDARALITSRIYIDMAEELRLRIDMLKHIIVTGKTNKNELIDFETLKKNNVPNNVSIKPEDLAVILYTSGTTGHPKGAMLSHYNLVSNAIDSSSAVKINHKDTFICILPLFHSFAATVCMNMPILNGSRIVIMKSLKPFKRVIRAIIKNRVTIFAAIPSVYNILKEIKLPRILHSPLIKLFNPVKACISGAAALPGETFSAFESKFRVPLLEGYGLTEASPVVSLNPLKGPRIAGSIGLPLSKNIEMRIVDDKNRFLGADETGELVVRGPNVMQGYYKQPEASKETIKNSWLFTGDIAKFDQNGYFYIVGRKKEMVNVRGLNVYPREIEETLYQNPKIKEAAVIGITDKHKGEVPKAFVVLKENEKAGESEIIHYLREKLAPYKIPKHVEFRRSLPKNTTGKILKRLLENEEQENIQ